MLFFLFFGTLFSQNFNPDSILGTYDGQWDNTTFSSTGGANAVITMGVESATLNMVIDLDGFVGGMSDPDPRTFIAVYDGNGLTIDTSIAEGDLLLTWEADGTITWSMTNMSNPNFDSQTGSGFGNSQEMMLDYVVNFSMGNPAVGTAELTKEAPSSVEEIPDGQNPSSFRLYKNYPNPFNPATNIIFSLPEQSDVVINVYNQIGELVTELVNENMQNGSYSVTFDAADLPSGIYYYQMTATANDGQGSFSKTEKMVLLK